MGNDFMVGWLIDWHFSTDCTRFIRELLDYAQSVGMSLSMQFTWSKRPDAHGYFGGQPALADAGPDYTFEKLTDMMSWSVAG